ncbi:uncharacterized protein LOC135713184, partial [Ochlerotatus camptorhynchus]|uniref:uncharacterized protein LOC135713184 n=1 Tax=Ochlerotatus camptorhynchus TaxID=644619 RepID=UPI0031DF78FD
NHVAAQYDYGDYNTATASPAYPSYPDYNTGTDINYPGTDYQTIGTPDYNYVNPTTGVNGGVDPGLYPNYDNYDVITQPPVVVNPTTISGSCNPVPRTIVNWYLGPPRSPSLRRQFAPMRHQRIYTEYKFPWNRVYGVSQYRARPRIAPRRQQIAKYRYGAYRRGGGAAQVMRYFWRF